MGYTFEGKCPFGLTSIALCFTPDKKPPKVHSYDTLSLEAKDIFVILHAIDSRYRSYLRSNWSKQ